MYFSVNFISIKIVILLPKNRKNTRYQVFLLIL
jgi:hypothetical protein